MSPQEAIQEAQRLLKQAFPALVFSVRRLSSGQIRGVFLEWYAEEKRFVRDVGLAATRWRLASAPERTLIFGFDAEPAVRARDTDGLLKSKGVAYVGLVDDPSRLREKIAEKIADLVRGGVGGLAPEAVRQNAKEFGKALRDGVWHQVAGLRSAISSAIWGLRSETLETRRKAYQNLAEQPRDLFTGKQKALAALVKRYDISFLLPDAWEKLKVLDAALRSAVEIHVSLIETLQKGYNEENCRRVVKLIQRLSETIDKGEPVVWEVYKLCADASHKGEVH